MPAAPFLRRSRLLTLPAGHRVIGRMWQHANAVELREDIGVALGTAMLKSIGVETTPDGTSSSASVSPARA